MRDSTDDTLELPVDQIFSDQFFVREATSFNVEVGGGTNVGKVRSRNEDHFAVARRSRVNEFLMSNLPDKMTQSSRDETHALIVADGVGGGTSGDRASQLALELVFSLGSRAANWVMRVDEVSSQDMYKRINAYVQEIQARFRDLAKLDPDLERMGTTCTTAYIVTNYAFVAHVGDSRAYLFRNGQLQQITRDQTVAQDLIDTGMPSEAVKRLNHLLTNCFGGVQESVTADIYRVELMAGDRLLLCTDGLSDMVQPPAIADTLSSVSNPQACSDRLIEQALENGGKDNVTVVVCNVS